MIRTLAAASLLGLAACNVTLAPHQLDSTAQPDADQPVAPLAGIAYSLPYARFDVDLTWTLASCAPLKITTTGAATVSHVADPSRTFVIDYTDLSSVMKTSKVAIELHENGMLKKFNAAADDQTGPVVVGTLKTIASVAATAAGLGPLGGGVRSLRTGRPVETPCTQAAYNAVEKANALKAVSDAASDAASQAAKRLTALSPVYTALAPDDARARAAYFTEARALETLRTASVAAAKAYADALKPITITRKLTWPSAPGIFAERIAPSPAATADKNWFSNPSVAFAPHAVLALAGDDALAVRLPDFAAATLGRDGDKAQPWQPLNIRVAAAPTGITYRQPVHGTLTLHGCAAWQMKTGRCDGDIYRSSTLASEPIPQLARLQVLPYRNGPFQNNELSATFTEAGMLATVSYEEKSSQAKAAVQAAQDAVAAVQAGIKDARAAGPAAILADLKARTEIATQRKTLADAVKALSPPKSEPEKEQTALFNTDTTLKNAEIANIEAIQALAEAKAKAAAK